MLEVLALEVTGTSMNSCAAETSSMRRLRST
jgi:hypothetical protein